MTKILVIGLDCAAPEILFGDERLTHFSPAHGQRLLRQAGERDPPHHRSRLDVHGHQPGPRLAGRLRLPQPGQPLLRRPSLRQRPLHPGAGHLGPGLPAGRPLQHHRRSPVLSAQAGGRHLRGVLPDSRHRPQPLHPPGPDPGEDQSTDRELPGRRERLPHPSQGLVEAADRRHDPHPLRGGPPLPAPLQVGLLPVGGDRPGPHPPRLLAVS